MRDLPFVTTADPDAPGVITGIRAALRPGRYVIEVDGAPVATVHIAAVERLRLAVGQRIAPLDAELQREEAALRTYDRALDMLASRPRSRADLRRQLLRKGQPAEYVEAALERLAAAGFLDDAAYARQLVRGKVLGPGFAKRRLGQELFRHGVARDVADQAIAEVLAEEEVDLTDVVERVARRRLRSLASLDPATRRRRLYAFLARRGYEPDEIRRAVESVLEKEVDTGE